MNKWENPLSLMVILSASDVSTRTSNAFVNQVKVLKSKKGKMLKGLGSTEKIQIQG